MEGCLACMALLALLQGGAQQMTGEASADLWAEDGSNDLFTSQFTWHTVVWGLSQGHRVRKWQS